MIDWGDLIDSIGSWIGSHGARILLIVVGSWIFYQIIKVFLSRVVRRLVELRARVDRLPKEDELRRIKSILSVLIGALGVAIFTIATFMVLSELNINIGPLIASAGVAGIAIGFGAQSLIKDTLNGLFIMLEDQFNPGDVVKIVDISGQVEDFNMRRTVLRDLDGIVHIIPNSLITTVSNFTREWARVNINVSVDYGTDLEKAIAVINKVGKELAADENYSPIIISPPQVLRVENLADSGVEIKIVGDTRPNKQWQVAGELRLRLKKAFDENGIEIPFPQTKVSFDKSQIDQISRLAQQRNPADSSPP
ncbi:mechanosensitive ion channel family protein [Dehalogenimonas etheniformans]|uniref:Mechanosensitive ion channel family protein n=1 Tax=Dehalogenimonas etheniformans TaxID=1536648 RepID=A0A2P5P748_9CHLR|nr:mechanosensitive ion channel family protein [Dehalogenimonas etheniformans]PPD58128.1 mechanosensitive ion channel family protein [Dehalogenimonas etheniformans]QNT75534.1 mechanosensitive ion channel family protein [Dehalogenimonas etheniformans]